jgi:tripartite-type tricarboxylate transporter receptor subunit TctC
VKKIITLLLLCPLLALAWEPTRPITAYVGYAPGSGAEVAFRAVAAEVTRANPKINFVIQNMPGQDGVISVNHTYQLPPDGYSINLTGNISTYVTNEVFEQNGMKYAVDDLYPIMSIASSPQCIVANTSSKINNMTDFVKFLAKPEKPVNVAVGSSVQRLIYGTVMEGSKGDTSKVKMIMYKGPMQALMAAAGGETEFGMMPIVIAKPMLDAGKVKLIALSSEYRMPEFPKTQLVKDVIPGTPIMAMWNITLPKGTPDDVVAWYNKVVGDAIKSENVKQFFKKNYMRGATDLDPTTSKVIINNLRTKLIPVGYRIIKEGLQD